jgi:hypothetical protein
MVVTRLSGRGRNICRCNCSVCVEENVLRLYEHITTSIIIRMHASQCTCNTERRRPRHMHGRSLRYS